MQLERASTSVSRSSATMPGQSLAASNSPNRINRHFCSVVGHAILEIVKYHVEF